MVARTFPRSNDRGLIEAEPRPPGHSKCPGLFPRSNDRGLIEAFHSFTAAARKAPFPRSNDRGLIEASGTAWNVNRLSSISAIK